MKDAFLRGLVQPHEAFWRPSGGKGEGSQPLAGSAAVADADPLGCAVAAAVDGAELTPVGLDIALGGDPALSVRVVGGWVDVIEVGLPVLVDGAVTAAGRKGAHCGVGSSVRVAG